jgi:hypothetical protein
MGVTLTAWLRWVPEPKEEPYEILERVQSRAPSVPASPEASSSPTAAVTQSRKAGDAVRTNGEPVASRAVVTRSGARTRGPGEEGRPVEDVFEAQLALARLGICPGSLDGVTGSRTRNALRAFQEREKAKVTGELDAATRQRLRLHESPFRHYTVTAADLGRVMAGGATGSATSASARSAYATGLEWIAELSWSHPDYVRLLNPTLDWARVREGTQVLVPNVSRARVEGKGSFVRIQLGNRVLQVFDEQVRLIAHYPCSIPRGLQPASLRVEVLVKHPDQSFRFAQPDSARGGIVSAPPGPNHPAGTVWIGLDRAGYGIHGTANPESAGSADSSGCFAVANWNAEHLLELSWVGMPVHIEP